MATSREQPVQEPFRARGFAPVESLAIKPEAAPLRILGAVIIAGQRVFTTPPFSADALGALDGGDLMQHAAPFETQGRPVGNFGDRLDPFRPLKQANGSGRRRRVLFALGLREKESGPGLARRSRAALRGGEGGDDKFRDMASDEIDRFRREIRERTGDQQQAENLTDEDLLREVMNTVGKAGRLGEAIRCVVSVSMLTEGWDTNTVTHVLGVRAFGTQLLCEQVIGRALRRQSYELNEDGLFNVEYADVLGIPFDFTAKPVIAPPQPPRETIQVKAVRPERDALEITFPRVAGYRVELPAERLNAEFNADSVLELTPDLVGPSITGIPALSVRKLI